jgi:hypothetical protein
MWHLRHNTHPPTHPPTYPPTREKKGERARRRELQQRVPNEPAPSPGPRHQNEAEVLGTAAHPKDHLTTLAVSHHLSDVGQPRRRVFSSSSS